MFLQVSKLSFSRLFILALLFQQFNVGSEAKGAIITDCITNEVIFDDTVTTTGSDIYLATDTLRQDTTISDTTVASDMLESEIKYSARDSMPVDLENEITHLYGSATLDYEDLHLTADYIMIDMANKELFASGITDTSGNTTGNPQFSQGNQKFRSNTIRYNFKSKKGKIGYVITQEGEGYIHGEIVKKDADNNFFIKKGQYTTCDLDTPHFAITSNRLKVIKNNKIITGPAFITIEGVPTPLIIPFGFFPNKQGRSSGIIFPSFGESTERGFYFQNLGYYFGFNDYITTAITTDLYSKGSYTLNARTLYKKRYSYSGNLDLNYAYTVTSSKELPDYSERKDFHISWRHTQDPKVNPNSNFSATVNAGSADYYQNTISSTQNFLSNTLNSSIIYTYSFPDSPINLGISASHSQNTITRDIQVNLPDISFSVSRITPFKRKTMIGRPQWYEKIGLSYSLRSTNFIQTKDSLLFTKESLDNFQNGIIHSIPISTSFNIMNYFNVTPSINYTERWYYRTIEKKWNADSNRVETRNVNGFEAARDYQASMSVSTIVYGMYQFGDSYVRALRHVMKPILSVSYRPDYSEEKYGYYRNVQYNEFGDSTKYSIFENTIYGGPSGGQYATLNFGLDNNLEMKVRTNSDTGATVKKVKLLESFNISGNYNLIRDSMKLSVINLSGRTTFFNKISLTFGGVLNPYKYDERNIYYDEFLIADGGPLANLTNANLSLSFSLNRPPEKSTNYNQEELNFMYAHPEEYINFDIPYNFSVSYSMQYNKTGGSPSVKTQSASFNGDLSLTPKWKIGFNSWYDVTNGKFTNFGLNFHRDLHCWEMRMSWIPFGYQESWNFHINVKASILQDLKLDKQKPYYDN